jgi:hypothetical protein
VLRGWLCHRHPLVHNRHVGFFVASQAAGLVGVKANGFPGASGVGSVSPDSSNFENRGTALDGNQGVVVALVKLVSPRLLLRGVKHRTRGGLFPSLCTGDLLRSGHQGRGSDLVNGVDGKPLWTCVLLALCVSLAKLLGVLPGLCTKSGVVRATKYLGGPGRLVKLFGHADVRFGQQFLGQCRPARILGLSTTAEDSFEALALWIGHGVT